MKTGIFRARYSVLSLALGAAFSAGAQTYASAQLNEVLVTASRFPESAKVLPYGVSIITSDDIRASGASSVSEAVIRILGVPGRLDLSGGSNYTVDLRGFGATADSNQVVVVDGRRLNEADQSSTGLGAIPIASVERIEVMRGSGAVIYGEGATGGVIIVTTKAGQGLERKNTAQLTGAIGSNGLRDVRTSATLASGEFSVDVAANERRSDGHRENFSSVSNGLAASGQWSNDWLRLGLRTGRTLEQSGLPGALTAAQYEVNPAQASSLVDFGSIKSENAGVFAEAIVGDWQLGADVNQRAKKYNSSTSGSPYAYDVDASNANVRARHTSHNVTFSNAFVVGMDNNQWDRTIRQASYTPVGTIAKSRSTAWYLTDDVTYVPTGTRFSAGWRTEKLDKEEAASASRLDDTQNAWDLGLSQALGSQTTVYGRTGQSFRLANVDEFSFTNPGVPLKAQTSRDLEVGARWVADRTKVDVRWYRNDLTNEIGYDPTAAGPSSPVFNGANINFDPTRRQGLELEVRHAVTAAWEVRANAATRQAYFTEGTYAGNDVALVPRQTAALGVNWKPAAGHTLDAGLNWVSTQSPTFDNMCSMPGYATVDARYAYAAGNVEFALGVKNMGDTKYYTQAFTCTAGVTSGIYPEAGRAFVASLQVKF